MQINKFKFGILKTGEEVFKYTLKNKDLEISILNYGGIITEIIMPDKDGKNENIVLGYDNILDYEEKAPYFGAITGRVAGRIAKGKFTLEEKAYNLAINNGENNLHGGIKGLDKRIWDVELLEDGIELSYISPHMEEGFPGEVKFKVRYILKGTTLELLYTGIPDEKTLINLTNHTYFNLSGNCKESILNHKLYIDADKVPYLDTGSIPTGELFIVEGTPFDFRTSKNIGKDIGKDDTQLNQTKGYDHPFILNKNKDVEVILDHKASGRAIEIRTDREAVVVYSGNYLGDDEGKLSCGVEAKQHLGVCLETQELPNNINIEEFKSSIYDSKNSYEAKTIFRFKTEGKEVK